MLINRIYERKFSRYIVPGPEEPGKGPVNLWRAS
jgi:hypothetical protein